MPGHSLEIGAARRTATQPAARRRDGRAVALWLLVCAAMVFAIAVIGAITRLTESGLSIMEWAPLSGALPPLSEAEWQRLFALYQTIPQYQNLNAGMELAEFKTIFWWEWVHRLWGRLIGVVFVLPFLWFWLRGRLSRALTPKLLLALALGGLQGLIGWFMVASGFVERDAVSQYRLALHLLLAVAIYGYLLWLAFDLLLARPADIDAGQRRLRGGLIGLLGLLGITLISGAFVAGTDAGLVYNSFPLMDGRLVPQGYGRLSPWWMNAFESIVAIQFNHRLLAVLTVAASLALWLWSRRRAGSAAVRRAFDLLAGMAGLQFVLGVATLLLVVPVWLGALHQAGALLLVGLAAHALFRLSPRA